MSMGKALKQKTNFVVNANIEWQSQNYIRTIKLTITRELERGIGIGPANV